MLRQVTVGFHSLEGKHYQWVRRRVPQSWTRPILGRNLGAGQAAVRTQHHSLDAPRIIRARQGWPHWLNWPHWTEI